MKILNSMVGQDIVKLVAFRTSFSFWKLRFMNCDKPLTVATDPAPPWRVPVWSQAGHLPLGIW